MDDACLLFSNQTTMHHHGFDVTVKKTNRAFHDFKPSTDLEHDMIKGYNESVADFIEKKRELVRLG